MGVPSTGATPPWVRTLVILEKTFMHIWQLETQKTGNFKDFIGFDFLNKGEKRMSTGPKHKWGGSRPGAGRPKSVISGQALKPLNRALEQAKKEHGGKDIYTVLVEFVYREDLKVRDRISAAKIIVETLTARNKEKEDYQDDSGIVIYDPDRPDLTPKFNDDRPRVWLPKQRPDPAKVLQGEPKEEGKSPNA